MDIETRAFFDELTKIAALQQREDVTRERLVRAAKAGLAAAGGMGLGMGIGNLLSSTVIPKILDRTIPHPTASQLQKAMWVAAGLGSLGSLATDVMRARALKYIREGDQRPQDFLMGHEKLNPEHGAQV